MSDQRTITPEAKRLHESILYPSVRVRAGKALGSGTVIYSRPADPDHFPEEFETLVLTNHHVVDDLIEVKEDWDAIRQLKRYREFRTPAVVEFFEMKHHSRVVSKNGKEATIVAWDDKVDLALLRLESVTRYSYVATLASADRMERGLYAFDEVYTVGAALGEDPVVTHGQIAQFDRKIEGHPYMMTTAPSVFGNSGGAVYLAEMCEMIGVPARIAVAGFGSPITHLSYSIPMTTIYKFLEQNCFHYVFDPSVTSKSCEAERDRRRKAAESRFEGPRDPNEPKDQPATPYGIGSPTEHDLSAADA